MSTVTVFLIILAVVFATVAFFTEPSKTEKRTRERLAEVSLRPIDELDEGILRRVTYSRIPFLNRWLRKSTTVRELTRMLEQANVPWTIERFLTYTVLLMMGGAALGNGLVSAGLLGWLGALLGLVPLLWVLYRRSVRINKFNVMIPHAVDLMSRGLQAGYALPSAMVMVADELPDPIGPEFRRTADEINFGLPFREALLNLSDRYPMEDLQFLVTAILVQKDSGGNLVELLQKLAVMLRARIQLKQKVRVFTAQGRLSGMVLVAMPFVMFFLINIVNPGYSKPMLESETGRGIIYVTLVMIGIGVLIIRRIVNIRV